ncbi:MAG: HEAT repeat domain-containing protein, partial [Candidatus Hodarchaeales archaeon]
KGKESELMVPLRDLGGELAIERLLEILGTISPNKRQHFLFQVLTLGGYVAKPILNVLKHTKDTDYARELIRAIGLMGLGETIEPFLKLVTPFRNDLTDIVRWTVFRLGLRHPLKLINMVELTINSPDKFLLEAMASLGNKEFIKPFRQAREQFRNTNREYEFVSYLLRCGDQQSIPRALTLLERNDIPENKALIIRSLAHINDPDSKDFLIGIVEDRDPRLMIEALITLTMLNDSRVVSYWVQLFKNESTPVNFPEFHKIVINLPYLELIEGILAIASRIIKLTLDNQLNKLFPEIDMESWVQKFPFLVNLLTVTIDENEVNQFSRFLEENGIEINKGKTFTIKEKTHQFIFSVYSIHNLIAYLSDTIIKSIFPLTDLLIVIGQNNGEDFFDFIRSQKNDLLVFLSSLCFQKYPTEPTIDFLTAIANDSFYFIEIRRTAYLALLYNLVAFPASLENNWEQFNEFDLLTMLRRFNYRDKKAREVALTINGKTLNPRVKLYSGLVCGNRNALTKSLESIYIQLTNDEDVRVSNEIIVNNGLINLMEDVLNHFITLQSHNARMDCLKTIGKLNDDDTLIALITHLHEGKIESSYVYDIKRIIEENINARILIKVIEFHNEGSPSLDEDFVLKLLVKSRNPEFWKDILSLLNKKDDISRLGLYDIEKIIPLVNIDGLDSLYRSQENPSRRDFLLELLSCSGKRIYAKEWVKISNKRLGTETDSIDRFYVRNSHQAEVLTAYLSSISDEQDLKTIFSKIYWNNDLVVVYCLTKLIEGIEDSEVRKELEKDFYEQFGTYNYWYA